MYTHALCNTHSYMHSLSYTLVLSWLTHDVRINKSVLCVSAKCSPRDWELYFPMWIAVRNAVSPKGQTVGMHSRHLPAVHSLIVMNCLFVECVLAVATLHIYYT